MKEWLEYAAVWVILKLFGALPRGVARWIAVSVARTLLGLVPGLKRVALFNLGVAFPDWTDDQKLKTVRKMTRYLAWQAVEFARFPHYNEKNIFEWIKLEGNENFLEAKNRGKGVLFLTGHIGAWEFSSFAHALYGHPLHYMARHLDNSKIDALVNSYRSRSGSSPIYKDESARHMLKVLRAGGTIGILADQNTMPQEGVFVDFFGTQACTTTGIARVALHTDAAVVPAYAYWNEHAHEYKLRFLPALELIRTGDINKDVFENTQNFAKVTEAIIRSLPEQWTWIHARWKTRPDGEAPLYKFL
jgi:KDO2-lipid IV(A) lauroyltransferase